MTRAWRGAAALLILLVTGCLPAVAQSTQPSVAIRPLVHEHSIILDRLAGIITSTLSINLKLVGLYSVRDLSDAQWRSAPRDSSAARRYGLDNIVEGSIRENGTDVELSLSVYSAAADKRVMTKTEKTTGYLQIFAAIDSISADLLEGFTRKHLTFGSLVFTNTGLARDYEVVMDGHDIAKDPTELPRVLTGAHRVEVKDIASGRTVFDRRIVVSRAKSVVCRFAIPFIYPDELAHLQELDQTIASNWQDPSEADRVRATIRTAEAYLRQRPGRGFEPLQKKYSALALRFARRAAGPPVVPSGRIVVDGDPADWRALAPAVRSTASGGGGRQGSIVRLDLAKNSDRLYFLARVSGARVDRRDSYQIAFTSPRAQSIDVTVRYRRRRWEAFASREDSRGRTEPIAGSATVKVSGAYLEGEIDLSNGGLRQAIESGGYSVSAKTIAPRYHSTTSPTKVNLFPESSPAFSSTASLPGRQRSDTPSIAPGFSREIIISAGPVAQAPIATPRRLSLIVRPTADFPIANATLDFKAGLSFDLGLAYRLRSGHFYLAGAARYASAPVRTGFFADSLSTAALTVGGGYAVPIANWLGVDLFAAGGYYLVTINDLSAQSWNPAAEAGIGLRFPARNGHVFELTGEYRNYFGLYQGLSVGLSTQLPLGRESSR